MSEVKKKPRSKWMAAAGVALILLSGVCFFTMLSVPLLNLSAARKGLLGGTLFVGVQAFWWIGVALLGPAAIKTIRGYFRSAD